ncbi:MAG: carboxypeptidase-like regulatory domain-containing protein [Myxococcaceae bacterium]
MSQAPVKIAIALSVLCLFASIAFYVSSTRDEDATSSAPADTSKSSANVKVGSGSFGQGHAIHDGSGNDGLPVADQIDGAPGSQLDDAEADDHSTEALIAGRIVAQGELPADAVIYLVKVKSFDPPEDESEPDVSDDNAIPDSEDVDPDDAAEPEVSAQQLEQQMHEAQASGDREAFLEKRALLKAEFGKQVTMDGVVSEAVAQEEPVSGGLRDAVDPDEEEGEHAIDEGDDVEPIYADENGEFESYVSPGEYKLIVRAEGYLPVQLEGITVHAGEEARGLMIELQKGFQVGGYVSVEDRATIPDGIAVTLEGEGYRLTAYTDENGTFSFDGLPQGSFKVRAFDPSVGSASTEARAGDTAVSLAMKLKHLSGTLLDKHGQPLANADVVVRGNSVGSQQDRDPYGPIDGLSGEEEDDTPQLVEEQYGLTDENGHFEVPVASEGGVNVSAEYDGAFAFAKDVSSDTSNLNLRLEDGLDVKVRATPKDPEGGEGWVEIAPVDPGTGFETQAFSMAQGEITFHVPPGVPYLLYPDGNAQLELAGNLPPTVKVVSGPPEEEYEKNAQVY